jgi:two-component system response regulator GlrR
LTIRRPPLRERGDDLPRFAQDIARQFGRELKKDVRGIAPEAMVLLRKYPWPGSVRELRGVITQVLLQTTGLVVRSAVLPAALRNQGGHRAGPSPRRSTSAA